MGKKINCQIRRQGTKRAGEALFFTVKPNYCDPSLDPLPSFCSVENGSTVVALMSEPSTGLQC